MKIQISILFIVVIACVCCSYGQNDPIYINEGESAMVCGKIVRFEGIWIDNGKKKADISILDAPNSKPITGGYSEREKIMIIDECAYYLQSIYKKGISQKGVIRIGREMPDVEIPENLDRFTIKIGEHVLTDDPNILRKVYFDTSGQATAYVYYFPVNDLCLYSTFTMKVNLLWYEGYPYRLSEISVSAQTATFAKLNSYFYQDGPVIKGEEINKRVDMDSTIDNPDNYLIRKMKYINKEKVTPEDSQNTPYKIYLLKIDKGNPIGNDPYTEVERNGVKSMVPFVVVKEFKDENEARQYASDNNIVDINLEAK